MKISSRAQSDLSSRNSSLKPSNNRNRSSASQHGRQRDLRPEDLRASQASSTSFYGVTGGLHDPLKLKHGGQGGSMMNEEMCIGQLEHNLHVQISRMHVPHYHYRHSGPHEDAGVVYSPPLGYFSQLDRFADDPDGENGPPLVLLGPSGAGKSALLANWLHHRQEGNRHARGLHEEFVFSHVVGCSRPSTLVPKMLRRLITELRAHFELPAEVPHHDDRLPWELPRFLEMAARKGRVLLVIDGITRFQAEDGNEAGLQWLPLEFPPQVRLIVSGERSSIADDETVAATVRPPSDGYNLGSTAYPGGGIATTKPQISFSNMTKEERKSRILIELERREWDKLTITNLTPAIRASIVKDFIRMQNTPSVPATPSRRESTKNGGGGGGFFLTSLDENDSQARKDDDNISIASSVGVGSPLYLFHSQRLAIINHPPCENALYLRIFLSAIRWSAKMGYDLWMLMEKWWGTAKEPATLFEAILQSWENGSKPTRRSTQRAKNKALQEVMASNSDEYGGRQKMLDAGMPATITPPSEQETGRQQTTGRNTGRIDHRDHGSNAQVGASEAALPRATAEPAQLQWGHSKDQAEEILKEAKTEVTRNMDDLIKQATDEAMRAFGTSSKQLSFTRRPGSPEMGKTFVDWLVQRSREQEEEAMAADHSIDEYSTESDSGDEGDEPGSPYATSRHSSVAESAVASSRRESTEVMHALLQPTLPDHRRLTNITESSQEVLKSNTMREVEGIDEMGQALEPMIKQSEGFEVMTKGDERLAHLPMYLRGGSESEGFGSLLGNALSMLYVARHGLTEQELFSMLVTQRNVERLRKRSKGTEREAEQLIYMKLSEHRGRLIDLFRSMDTDGDGELSHEEFRQGVHALGTDITDDQIDLLIQTVDQNNDGGIDSKELMDRFDKNARAFQRGERFKTKMLGNADHSISPTLLEDEDQSQTKEELGALLEQSLLEVLRALGVMHYRHHSLLLLPMEAKALRQAVYERYIKTKDGEFRWHFTLVRFFFEQAPTLRRCEELPWHLGKCRRWTALKDTLIDLRTFNLMYAGNLRGEIRPELQGDLKRELFHYWELLTQGPLYISDEAAAKAQVRDPNDASMFLEELESYNAMGLSEAQARTKKLTGQVATFDPVDEFNRSIEAWQHAQRPTTQLLALQLKSVAAFLKEFTEEVRQTSTYPFLHRRVKYNMLQDIGIDELLKKIFTKGGMKNKSELEQDGEKVGKAAQIDTEKLQALISVIGVLPRDRSHDVRQNKDKAEEDTDEDQSLIKIEGLNFYTSYYYFLRWIWMQFPWIALANAKQNMVAGDQPEQDDDGMLKTGESLSVSNHGNRSIDASSASFHRQVANKNLLNSKSLSALDHKDLRHIVVKKKDPFTIPKGFSEYSKNVKDAHIHASLKHASMLESINQSIETLTYKEWHARDAPLPNRMKVNPLSKEESLADLNAIPFAYSSLRSMRVGSRFPTLENIQRSKVEEFEKVCEDNPEFSPTRFGGLTLPQNMDEYLKMRDSEEFLSNLSYKGNFPAHSFTMPLTVEQKGLGELYTKVAKLRKAMDGLTLERKQRKKRQKQLLRDLQARTNLDNMTSQQLVAGERMITALQERLFKMQQAIREAEALGKFYRKIIELCIQNPAKDPKHLEAMELQVSLAKQQCSDLMDHRQQLIYETDFVIKNQIKKFKNDADAARQYTAKTRQDIEDLAMKLQRSELNSSQLEADRYDTHSNPDGKAHSESPSRRISVNSSSQPMQSVIEQVMQEKAKKIEEGIQKLRELTGTSQAEDMIEKLRSREQMIESFEEQIVQEEARRDALKQDLKRVQIGLEELQFQGDDEAESANGKDAHSQIRNMDDKIFPAEIRLSQNMRKAKNALRTIQAIRTGVQHLARMINEGCNLDNDMKAVAGNATRIDISDSADITEMLQQCENAVSGLSESVALQQSKQFGDDISRSVMARREDAANFFDKARRSTYGIPDNSNASTIAEDLGLFQEPTAQRKRRKDLKKSLSKESVDAPLTIELDPDGVKVVSKVDKEFMFEEEMKRVQENNDKAQKMEESEAIASKLDQGEGVAQFLSGALSTKDCRVKLMKANNLLSPGKRGHSVKMGIAMTTVLQQDPMSQNILAQDTKMKRKGRSKRAEKREQGSFSGQQADVDQDNPYDVSDRQYIKRRADRLKKLDKEKKMKKKLSKRTQDSDEEGSEV